MGAKTTRADLHISISRDGELFITSRQDGMIRMLVPDESGAGTGPHPQDRKNSPRENLPLWVWGEGDKNMGGKKKKEDGRKRLAFPSAQLDEVLGLLLQVKQLHAEKTQDAQTRSVLVADRVGVLVQPDAAVLDFVVGGAPISFAIPTEMATQLMQILQQKLPSP